MKITESFEMVKPGDVYASVIEEGDIVDGRVAEVALQLGKGVKHPSEAEQKAKEEADAKAAKAAADAKAKEDADVKAAEAGQGSLLDSQTPVVPESKVGAHGEVADAHAEGEAAK
ncbi:MAG: hypothetical protein OIF58_11110 [Cohaesibacter sp.]|nr:hypothetical protein [Cohaesibacter sp.]